MQKQDLIGSSEEGQHILGSYGAAKLNRSLVMVRSCQIYTRYVTYSIIYKKSDKKHS